ncbi:structural maintenance of chromosomes protein 5-like protein [Corchorus olitorius]|uniref:Structural maintenance of chromosomes protein 5-like protein n=1 Tax=Corchorus olitorius TaxID=93759 RepID=A0A1R3JD46_9ROSI|nr:structural maintenance of chromosomes protein 5-like protein [Corchorus olitorius]
MASWGRNSNVMASTWVGSSPSAVSSFNESYVAITRTWAENDWKKLELKNQTQSLSQIRTISSKGGVVHATAPGPSGWVTRAGQPAP